MAIRHFAASSLGLWLYKATSAFRASPTSRLAVSVQQQLQGSGLLQHVGALLTAAADGLTAAAAVVFGEPAHSSSSNSRGPSSSCGGTGGNVAVEAAHRFFDTLGLVHKLLNLYNRAYDMIFAAAAKPISLGEALPAAVHLILTTL
jgi:hypothetical protein